MNKETIELERRVKHIKGYGFWGMKEWRDNDPEVLDEIVKWSEGKSVKVYKHTLRIVEENISDTEFYYYAGVPSAGIYDNGTLSQKIPYCDWVCYLEIYWQ